MKKLEELDDSQLMEYARKGEAEAFGELYARYVDSVYRFIYERLDNRRDGEDLTEEVFLRAWDSLPRYHKREVDFSAYLLRIAQNSLIHNKLYKK